MSNHGRVWVLLVLFQQSGHRQDDTLVPSKPDLDMLTRRNNLKTTELEIMLASL